MAANVEDTIMLLGDSITQFGFMPQGFAQLLADAYVRKLGILNRGLSGYNTTQGLKSFQRLFAKKEEQQHVPKVRLLTIWFGANDACVPPSTQHVPLPKFKENLSSIIQMVKDPKSDYYSPSTRIILFNPPPVVESTDRRFDVTKQYAEAVQDVAEKEKVPMLDVWSLIWEAAGQKKDRLTEYMPDGLHLNGKGYKIVYDGLAMSIQKYYPEILPRNLPDAYS